MNDMEKNAEIENLRNRMATHNEAVLSLKCAVADAQHSARKWRVLALVSSVVLLVMVMLRVF